ncbi:MAG: replication factor C large subunit [Candidatus Nanoarchaeia archaeon]|nr:replication factor C large subunit [Candidatus Nanoarchaeia archaeon]
MKTWVDKYKPETLKDIEGHNLSLAKLKEIISTKGIALVHGLTGTGKTSSIYALAKDLNLEVMELNASDIRNKSSIESIVGNALGQMSLFSRGKLILLDEIDGLSGQQDRGGATTLAKLLSDNQFPIIMTANDPWDAKLAPIRKKSEVIEFKTPSHITVFNVLKKVCKGEGIIFEETILKDLARRAGGDIRGAINDLQSLTSNKELNKEHLEKLDDRKKEESIFNALRLIFKANNTSDVLGALDTTGLDFDEAMLWIDENLPLEYSGEDLAEAYDKLSLADVYKGRIRRRMYWRLLVYRINFMTAGVNAAKEVKEKGFVNYKRTSRILKLWQANMKYAKRKAIAQKLAKDFNVSTKRMVKEVIPYLKIMYQNGQDLELNLEPEEVEWLRA